MPRVRIFRAIDQPADPGVYQALGAGRSLLASHALGRGTGFESHDQAVRISSLTGRILEGGDLSMVTTVEVVPTTADNPLSFQGQCTNARVRFDPAATSQSEVDRFAHERFRVHAGTSAPSPTAS
jgi:hypothetical protein